MNDTIKEHFSEISLLICHDAKAVQLPLLILMSIVLSTSATSLISLLNKYTFSVLLFHESSNRMSVHLVYALPNLEYLMIKVRKLHLLFCLALHLLPVRLKCSSLRRTNHISVVILPYRKNAAGAG